MHSHVYVYMHVCIHACKHTYTHTQVMVKGQLQSVSFVKVINLNSKVIANNVHGGVSRSVCVCVCVCVCEV